jgi:MFS family permease
MAAEPRARYRDALAARDFRLLVGSFIVDQIGSWAYSVVLIVYIFDRTHSATFIALTTASSWVPRMLFTTYGGVLADRYERTQVLLASSLLCFVSMAGLALLVIRDGPIWLILAMSALTTALNAPFPPATQALVPEVVPETALVPANALFAGIESLVVVIGPAVGGLLLLSDDPASAMVLNAISFLASSFFIVRMKVRSYGGAGRAGESLLRQLTAGFEALGRNRVALILVLYCALDSSVYAAGTVLFVPLSERLGTGATGYSYLIAAFALGGVLATGVVNRVSSSSRLAPVILIGMFVLALPFAVASAVHNAALAFLLMTVAGVGMIVVDVLAITALQRSVPGEVMSRVFGVFMTIVPLALLAGSFVTAVVLRAFGLTDALLVVGLGVASLALLGIWPVVTADGRTAAQVRRLAPRVTLLQSLDMFAGASRAVLERLAGSISEVALPAGEQFIREGEAADALWVIVDGEVDVSARGEGRRRHHLRTMGAGTYVGEIGLLHGLARTATVGTTQTTTLWRIDRDDFFAAINDSGVSGTMLSQSRARLARSHPRLAVTGVTRDPASLAGE